MKDMGMNDGIPRGLDAMPPSSSAKFRSVLDNVNAQHKQNMRLVRELQEDQEKAARAKIEATKLKEEKDNQFRADLIAKQQQIIDTQTALLAEARKEKWITALIIGIICAIIPLLLQWIF